MKALLLLFVLLFHVSAFAEQFEIVGLRPFISLSKTFGPRWELNGFYAETINESDKTFKNQHYVPKDLQSYFQTGMTYKYSPRLNFSAGYVFQRNNPIYRDFVNENRLWQQFIFLHPVSYFTLSHRVRYEERFIDNRSTHHTNKMATRLRYQLSFTAPLQGKEIDPGEFFFNTYNEFYFSLTGERNAWYSENWSYAGLGFQTGKMGKFEVGPLAQWAKINRTGDTRVFYLLQFGWSYTFN